MIKTIIFDLNRVLITFRNINKDYRETFGITQKKFWKPVTEFFSDYAIGKTSLDQVLLNIMEKNKLDKNNLSEAKRLYEKNFSQIPGMNNLLGSLKTNYSLILAAGDGKDSLEMKIKKGNLTQYFDKIYATCYIKLMKTDINFYKEILSQSNLIPEEIIFIDDRKDNLNAAKKLNINVILFENLSKLENDLKTKFNLLF